MERATVLCKGTTITTDHLSYELSIPDRNETGTISGERASENAVSEAEPIDKNESEQDRILRILTKCSGNKAKAARLLGVDRSTLYRKMRLYNIDPTAF